MGGRRGRHRRRARPDDTGGDFVGRMAGKSVHGYGKDNFDVLDDREWWNLSPSNDQLGLNDRVTVGLIAGAEKK